MSIPDPITLANPNVFARVGSKYGRRAVEFQVDDKETGQLVNFTLSPAMALALTAEVIAQVVEAQGQQSYLDTHPEAQAGYDKAEGTAQYQTSAERAHRS